MTQLFPTGVRTALVAAVMVATVPMIAFTQPTEPALEGEPAAANVEEANANPTGDEESLENQSLRNELRRELLDDRAASIDRWLFVLAIALTVVGLVLAFFSIVAVVGGYIGFRRFQAIEADARNSAETAAEHAKAAEYHAEEAERGRDKVDEILQGITAETAADDPEKARQVVADVLENPEASPIDKAIADAISLQQQGRVDDAIEKWRAIAQVVEGSDNDLAALAWFSVGYLLQDRDLEGCIFANCQAIRLNPDFAEAYNNRGAAKDALRRYDDAITDFDQAIRLKPDYAKAYSNRGAAKDALKQYEDAVTDYDEAIRLKPDLAEVYSNRGNAKIGLKQYRNAIADFDQAIRLKPDYAEAYYNRGNAKTGLKQYRNAIADYDEAIRLKPDLAEAYNNRGVAKAEAELPLKDEARKDFEIALELARSTGNVNMVAHVEQSLRNLDDDESP